MKESKGISISIDGYKADTREIWQIPEVMEFLRMLIDRGMVSILEMMPVIAANGEQQLTPIGLGALELYGLVNGMVGTDNIMRVTQEDRQNFAAAVRDANELLGNRHGGAAGISQS